MPQRRPARDRPTGYLWLYAEHRLPPEQPHPTGPRMKSDARSPRSATSTATDTPDLLAVKKYTGNLYFYPRQALMACAGAVWQARFW